jgi:SAM-dependent methyltransferase
VTKIHEVFSTKAELYARYRWDYASPAIEIVFQKATLGGSSRVADIGAGTGILTRHLLRKAGWVVALEPNPEMRRIAVRQLERQPGCWVVAACAEDTALRTASIDLICVAQAIHWFNPHLAKREFHRILKPGGWLAILRNYSENSDLQEAISAFHTADYGVARSAQPVGSGISPAIYYGFGEYERMTFDFLTHQTWDEFLGALLSTSYAPDLSHPRYPDFVSAAQKVFNQFSREGCIEAPSATELYIGQPVCD